MPKSSFATVHFWNSMLCPPLGFALNFLLLWLILRRTPKEMVVHSRILLQTCFLDCLILACQTVGQIALNFRQKGVGMVIFFDGIGIRLFGAYSLPSKFWLLFFTVALSMHDIGIFGVTAQFIYRHLTLKRNVHVAARRYLLVHSFFIVFRSTVTTCIYFLSSPTLDDEATAIDVPKLLGNIIDFENGKPIFIQINKEMPTLLHILLALMVPSHIFTFAVNFFCGLKMVRFVRNHATFNAQLKELNRQLTRNLIILASFPVIVELFRTLIETFGYLVTASDTLNVQLVMLQLLFTLTFHWLPVLNPVASILTNRPYRNALFGGDQNGIGTMVSPSIVCVQPHGRII